MAEQKGIVFFKEIPSREWRDNPYTGFDIPSQKCLSYRQMNWNLSNLEGRDIKSIEVDENCNPVINLVNGEKLTVDNESCSGKGCVLKEDLDYSQMFVDGGCCYPTRHFGWLGQYGNASLDSHYNTNEGDYFPAGTSIEYVLRQILVSNGDLKPNVIVNLSCSSAHKDDNNYSWSFTDESTTKQGYTFSGTVIVNHSGDGAYVNNNCQLATNSCCDNGKVCLTNLQIKQNGVEITDYNAINLTINIKVNIQAKPVTPTVAEAYLLYDITDFLNNYPNPSINDVYSYNAKVSILNSPQPQGTPSINSWNTYVPSSFWTTVFPPGTTAYYGNYAIAAHDDDEEYSALIIKNGFEWYNQYAVFQWGGDKWYNCEIYENNENKIVVIDSTTIEGWTIYKFQTQNGISGEGENPNVPLCFNFKQTL